MTVRAERAVSVDDDGAPQASPAPKPRQRGYRDDAHAVIVGIDRYADPTIPDLRFARADAEGVYRVLTDVAIGGFRPTNVTLLVDADATERRIRTAIGTELAGRAAPGDTVVVYFAGHGAPVIDARVPSADGQEKYLLPADAEARNLRGSALAMARVHEWFEWIKARQVVCFLDCCYSGGAGGRGFEPPGYATRALLTDDYLERLGGEGRLVITACAAREVSLETPTVGHGLFTHHLIEGLTGAADADGDGRVSVDELYDYVYERVERDARALGGAMNPLRKGAIQGRVYLTQAGIGTSPPRERVGRGSPATGEVRAAARAQWAGSTRLRWTVGATLALAGTLGLVYGARAPVSHALADRGVYRVRATVVDSRDVPVSADSVWSDVGGEWQRISGGWEVTIPAATLPVTRRLVVRAARPDAFEIAADTLTLGADRNPTLTLRLRADTTALVRGTVIDARGRAVLGARVAVEGYGAEGMLTDSAGSFVLRAHAADGQQVRLRAEKLGIGAVELYHPAGRDPATLQLDRATSGRP